MRDAEMLLQVHGGSVDAGLEKKQRIGLIRCDSKPLEILIAVPDDLVGQMQYFSCKSILDFQAAIICLSTIYNVLYITPNACICQPRISGREGHYKEKSGLETSRPLFDWPQYRQHIRTSQGS